MFDRHVPYDLYFRIAVSVLILILLVALFHLQIIKGKEYVEIAKRNFVRIKRITPTRGEIYDQRYRVIATNVPSINLYLRPRDVRNKEYLSLFVSRHFPISYSQMLQIIHDNRFKTYQEIPLLENVSYDVFAQVSEQLNFYPALVFRVETMRNYSIFNHFTGYVGRINEKEYKKYKKDNYALNDMIGKTGLERYYESILRGKPGYEVIQVNAAGRSLNFFKENLNKAPENGLNLVLTINLDLQQYTQSIMPAQFNGAIAVIDVRTGGILAYTSAPEYDQNWFSSKITNEQWNQLSNNPNRPMLDRVIHAAYPPGSCFKPITGSLGLESKKITESTRLASCVGGMKIGNRFFKCWSHVGHGSLDILNAMRVSCDVFFYDLSLRLSLESMRNFTKANHLTLRTGVDLPNERAGLFPDKEWYYKHYGKSISIKGQKVNLAIGQGEVLVTPLQLAAYYAALANNGEWIRPHFLEKAIGDRTIYYKELFPDYQQKLPLSQHNLQIIQRALYQVVNAPGGTASAAKVPGVSVWGKTGSAENHQGPRTHAWFAGYAAWDSPEISVVVFFENAGHGGSMCAPLAGKIIQYYGANVRNKNVTKKKETNDFMKERNPLP